jgi:hypothetical protein
MAGSADEHEAAAEQMTGRSYSACVRGGFLWIVESQETSKFPAAFHTTCFWKTCKCW